MNYILCNVLASFSFPSQSKCHTSACWAVMRFYLLLPASSSPVTVIINVSVSLSDMQPLTHTEKKHRIWILTLFLEMHPLCCPPLWGKDRDRWKGKERERCLSLRVRRESQTISHPKGCPLVFSVDESRILYSSQSSCTRMRHHRGHDACDPAHLRECMCGAFQRGSIFLFWGFCLFVNGVLWNWGICIGMQDCLCQCNMLKQTLFLQCCHTVWVWRDTYRWGTLYRWSLIKDHLVIW